MTAENPGFRDLKRMMRTRRHDKPATTKGIDMASLAANLVQNEQGIWCSGANAECAYPEGDHDILFTLEDESFWFQHRNDCILTMVRQFPPKGFILDVGGGNGYVTKGLQEGGFCSILLEPNNHAVRNAAERGVTRIICSTFENADFRQGSIPAVGLFDLLEHIEDDKGLLNYLRPLLRLGARLYITVPAHRILWSPEDEYAKHFRRYSSRQLRNMLKTSGYVVDYVSHFFSYLPSAVLLSKMTGDDSHSTGTERARKVRRKHMVNSRLLKSVLSFLDYWELAAISRKFYVPWGSSLMAAAHVEK